MLCFPVSCVHITLGVYECVCVSLSQLECVSVTVKVRTHVHLTVPYTVCTACISVLSRRVQF